MFYPANCNLVIHCFDCGCTQYVPVDVQTEDMGQVEKQGQGGQGTGVHVCWER